MREFFSSECLNNLFLGYFTACIFILLPMFSIGLHAKIHLFWRWFFCFMCQYCVERWPLKRPFQNLVDVLRQFDKCTRLFTSCQYKNLSTDIRIVRTVTRLKWRAIYMIVENKSCVPQNFYGRAFFLWNPTNSPT